MLSKIKIYYLKINNDLAKKIYSVFEKILKKIFNEKISKEESINLISKSLTYVYLMVGTISLLFIYSTIIRIKSKPCPVYNVEINDFVNDEKYIDLDCYVDNEFLNLKLKVPKSEPTDMDIVNRLLNVLNENTIKGDNKNLSNITTDLNLISKNQYGALINYESKNGYVDVSTGKIIRPYKGCGDYKDTLSLIIQYKDIKKVREFYITIKELEITSEEENKKKLIEELSSYEKTDKAFSNTGDLIEKLNGFSIKWFRHNDNSNRVSPILYFVVIVIFILLIINIFKNALSNEKNKISNIENNFTSIIEDLYLLNNAGYNISNCIRYISYKLDEKNILKDHFDVMVNKLELGFVIYKILEEFAQDTKSIKIRKFIQELIINLKRGNPNIDLFYKDKIKDFYGNKKDIYKRKAEENNIKALLPLMIILITTMILVVYPAVITMNF